jgi:hypothetical protein
MIDSIRLGGRDYPVAALKFKDLKRILPLFLELGIDSEAKIEAQGDIISAAIRTADPAFTRAAFDELSPTIRELQDAVTKIAALSGLEPRNAPAAGATPGEARAAAPSTGAASTA